jgi:outer membrane protein TolC
MKALLPLVAAWAAAGCASFSDDAGLGPVRERVGAATGVELRADRSAEDREAIERRVRERLSVPLSADAAVEIALINHRGLQAEFAALGLAEADLVEAGRLPNPGFSFGKSRRGDEREIERSWHISLGRILAMPLARQVEQRRFEQAQSTATERVIAHAAQARKAYWQALGAEQSLHYMRQVQEAAEASAELARRMAQVGNFSALQQAREQAFRAEAALGVAQAARASQAARERLIRALGLWGEQIDFRLPDRLPDLPARVGDLPDIERLALEQRLDVQSARLAAEAGARHLGLSRATRFVNVIELGLMRNGSNEAPPQTGWEIGFELPIFDGGSVRMARAEAAYREAAHRAAQVAIDARSEVREAYFGYRSAYDIARHHLDEVVPLRKRISDENLLRYNGMLIGVFELLADARTQITSVNAAILAQRDFWIAQADLELALLGRASLSAPALPSTAPAADAAGGH